MMNFKRPFLIVGQGIAGTLLAWNFLMHDIPISLIDKGLSSSSSCSAAGIVNPVTGRRVVKSWMIDQLIPVARKSYGELENFLGQKLIHEQSILRSLFSIKEENLWLTKACQEEYQAYIGQTLIQTNLDGLLKNEATLAKIKHGFRVDLQLLLSSFRNKLKELGRMIEMDFDYSLLQIKADGISYLGHSYEGVIFCEGWNVIHNPWFKDVPLALNKGDAMLIEIPNTSLEQMLKHKLFVVPMGNSDYWVGSNYQWEFNDDQPSKEMQDKLQDQLTNIINTDFVIKKQLAGIRPSTDQRRPILGRHPKHERLHILNGMGTKGTSLAPYWSEQLFKSITHQGILPKEVDVRSFIP